MSRSSLDRSTNNRIGVELNNSSTTSYHRRSIPALFKPGRIAKKQLSLLLNKADFEVCDPPDEDEMLRFNPNNESRNNTNPSDATISDDTITERHQQSSQSTYCTSPTIPNKNRIISTIKHRLAPCRYETTKKDENNDEKNRGFLLIDQDGTDLGLISHDNIDQQHTRHAEPCQHGQLDEYSADTNQNHLLSSTPVTPSLLPPQQITLTSSSILPLINHSNSELDIQATQAGVECALLNYDESNGHDTQLSATNSSTSTDSSNIDSQFIHSDRSTLNDIDYVVQQKHDLERITIYEIALNNERREYQQDLAQNENEEIDFDLHYKDAVEQNLKFKEELKRLQEEKDRVCSKWSCEVCTYINEPYIITRKDVCEMCEGPSPLKRHTLTS
ncbi:unnamed protein product [Adineta steineri]|uniref:RanBP2-type domain-containing protein n=1 Tax=Adineta steineri TaxID=433720 RepID=A0A813ZYB0_9BILA|nr:unnamed protein product [Adineta steineri]CAF1046792.1 unnamed protein product [Adineta steineri]